jgi:hypothetical protein
MAKKENQTIMKLSFSASLLACFWAAENVGAFSVRPQRTIALPHSRAFMSPVETVTEVQEAVDIIESLDEEENDTTVRVKNEFPEVEVTKDELLDEIEELIEGTEEAMEDQVLNLEPEAPPAEATPNGLAGDISSKLHYTDEAAHVTAEEAAVSASLYLNPATSKIAQHVKISWEPEVAATISHLEKVSNPGRPFLVGIVGIPGSGKSTSAEVLAALLGEDRALVCPMDGFHIPLAQLAEFPNSADAIYRRGAPDTFDAKGLFKALMHIAHGDEPEVSIPGFDHAVGDPTPDQHIFKRDSHRIVLCEGLYVSYRKRIGLLMMYYSFLLFFA